MRNITKDAKTVQEKMNFGGDFVRFLSFIFSLLVRVTIFLWFFFFFILPLESLPCCHHPRLKLVPIYFVTSSCLSCGMSKWEQKRWVGALGGTWVTIRCWASLGICDSQLSQEQIFVVIMFLHEFHKSSRSWLGEIHLCRVSWVLWLLMTQMMFSSQKTFLEEDLITGPSSLPPQDCCVTIYSRWNLVCSRTCPSEV